MDFDDFFSGQLEQLRQEGHYRVFTEVERKCGQFPQVRHFNDDGVQDVTVWCSND